MNARLAMCGKTTTAQFIVSRIWRDRELLMPSSDSVLQEGDRLLTVTTEKNVDALTLLFGEKEDRDWNHHVNWNKLDRQLVSRHIVVSRPEINGKKLGSLRLRSSMGITVSRVLRSGVLLLATPDLCASPWRPLDGRGKRGGYRTCGKVDWQQGRFAERAQFGCDFRGHILGIGARIDSNLPAVDECACHA